MKRLRKIRQRGKDLELIYEEEEKPKMCEECGKNEAVCWLRTKFICKRCWYLIRSGNRDLIPNIFKIKEGDKKI